MSPRTWQEMASVIDWADLEVDTTENDLRLLSLQAEKFQIHTVVVNPVNVTLTKSLCKGLGVQVAAMISYPVGAYFPEVKGAEIEDAIKDGADQIYMVMAVGAFIDGWLEKQTKPEIQMLVEKSAGRTTKLVTEISVLNVDQRRRLCDLAIEGGVDYLVTTTDFDRSNLPAVTLQDIELLLDHVQGQLKIVHKSKFLQPELAESCLDLGVSHLCTENARKILQRDNEFPWA